MNIFLSLILVACLTGGCAAYSKTGKAFPDSFNLTDYHVLGTQFKGDTVAAGFSWTLK